MMPDWIPQVAPDTDRDPDQAWFWTPEWQAAEREAEADFAAGRSVTFDNVEDLIRWLHEAVDEDA